MTQQQLLSEQCSTCIFRPGNLMHLHEGRLADVVKANRAQGTALICHQTLRYGDHPEVGEAVCRGFYEAYKDENAVIQITERILGGFTEIPPPAPNPPRGHVPTFTVAESTDLAWDRDTESWQYPEDIV